MKDYQIKGGLANWQVLKDQSNGKSDQLIQGIQSWSKGVTWGVSDSVNTAWIQMLRLIDEHSVDSKWSRFQLTSLGGPIKWLQMLVNWRNTEIDPEMLLEGVSESVNTVGRQWL